MLSLLEAVLGRVPKLGGGGGAGGGVKGGVGRDLLFFNGVLPFSIAFCEVEILTFFRIQILQKVSGALLNYRLVFVSIPDNFKQLTTPRNKGPIRKVLISTFEESRVLHPKREEHEFT